ncbi:hypothetical protein H5T87_01590 [bacterium]|nr:hypothetical protein [bacterium]
MRKGEKFALWGSVLAVVLFLTVFLPGCGGGGGGGGAVTRVVSGVLTDAVTGQPIDGAVVELYQAPKNAGRVIAGAILLGQDTTHDGGKYSIPIHISGMLGAIFAVQPPPGTDYQPLEFETNLDASHDVDLNLVLILASNKPSKLEIIPPLPPGESYIGGEVYKCGYKAYDQSGQEMSLKGGNWYAKGDFVTINSQGEFIGHPNELTTIVIGLILSSDCKAEISLPIIPPDAILCATGSAANELKSLLSSADFTVQVQSAVPSNIGNAKVLVIDDSANLSTNDNSIIQNILNRGGNIVLIGDAPAIIATGNPLPPKNPDNQNWTPTDISPISSWFGGATKMLHVHDLNVHALSGGFVSLPPGVRPEDLLECEEIACVLTPINEYPKVSVIASAMYEVSSPDFPNSEEGGPVFAFAQPGGNGKGQLYWQWDYKVSPEWGQENPDADGKIKALFLNGVKWAAGTLITPQ